MSRADGVRAGRRGRWASFPAGEQMAAEPPVPDLGPVVWWLHLDGRDRKVDLSAWPCPRLTRQLAQTLRAVAAEGPGGSWLAFKANLAAVRKFVRFIAAAEPEAADQFEFADLEAEHLDAFE